MVLTVLLLSLLCPPIAHRLSEKCPRVNYPIWGKCAGQGNYRPVVQKLLVSIAANVLVSAPFADTEQSGDDPVMTSDDDQRPGLVWALIQDWMDSIPYPPSQRKLAARIGISPSALTDWKYGRGFPGPAEIQRLADEIGAPYERVLDAVLVDRGYRTHRPAPLRERGSA